ncbi:MAG: cytochrome C oxidase Cbb3 [Alteromonadaceae bacterium]|nr:MAG: cytochrome C oxidase Cbb3 [Alteromonadaceae bacterium]
MSEFDDIRPYNDDEVKPVLNRLINDRECIDTLVKLKFPKSAAYLAPVLRKLARSKLNKVAGKIHTVADFQHFMEGMVKDVVDNTIDELSVSGLERLDKDQAHLFISNHRDITMDSAMVNFSLYHAGFGTLRIAAGDNLLTKPFASDLMRLNKSFIVNRSATSLREKLKAAKLLSRYIHHSVVEDGESVWIAQREGRAKDGIDKTNPAIVSMLALSRKKPEPLEEHFRRIRIVPVTISYEYDPCGFDKARELYEIETNGSYTKGEQEDVASIAKGITGYKGDVHLTFGKILNDAYESTDEVHAELDRQIDRNYVLHASNCFAYEMLEGKIPNVPIGKTQTPFADLDLSERRKTYKKYIDSCPQQHLKILLRCYANPVYKHLELTGAT